MTNRARRSSQTIIWCISSFVAVMFIAAAAYGIKILLSDDSQKRKRSIQMVTLVKPPPPPKIKEKPPEPEIRQKEEIIEPEPEKPEPVDDPAQDDTPPGDELGLDADGAGGTDDFGLRAKKGGRALIGGYGEGSLLKKYSWYTIIIQKELRKLINEYMEKNGGIPEGDLKVIVQISMDASGNIVDYAIQKPSETAVFDSAVARVLGLHRFSEPPPNGMPKTLNLKISSKG